MTLSAMTLRPDRWRLAAPRGLGLALTVPVFILIGDGPRDTLDPDSQCAI